MRMACLHPWTPDPDQAVRYQEQLRNRLIIQWHGGEVRLVGGIDVKDAGDVLCAAVVVLELPELNLVECASAQARPCFPYIPGLLAFRTGQVILLAWQKLTTIPQLVMIHGQGIAHPRGIGLASHLGLWLGMPTIGVAKSRLYGHNSEVGTEAGNWSEVRSEIDIQRIVGAAIRTKANTKPIFVSPGHLIDLQHAVEFTLTCCRGFRIPEPLRRAHVHAAN